jgi:hypothetical protein
MSSLSASTGARTTASVVSLRTIEQLVARPSLTMKMLIRETVPRRDFRS